MGGQSGEGENPEKIENHQGIFYLREVHRVDRSAALGLACKESENKMGRWNTYGLWPWR